MQKTPSRSQKKGSNHVSRKNATAKSCFTKKVQILFTFRKTNKYDHYKNVFMSGNPEISPGGVQNEKIENP